MHGSVADTGSRSPAEAVIWTVGHGTRSTDGLAGLLAAAGATTVIDVRRYPAGRRQPRFARQRLEADLPSLGISYEWWGEALGGRRPMPAPPPTGTGLGLAGAKDLIELHGGSIRVTSVEGVGSTFVVRLPLRRPRPRRVLSKG
jgi:hypothetical protein